MYNKLDKKKHEGIIRAFDFNANMKMLTNANNMRVLAYFAIIEMLLTHNPNEKEIGDLLTHQIKTKIALISSRLDTPINYTTFGAGVAPDKIWSALYNFRSSIAHGNHINFQEGKCAVLKDPGTATTFVAAVCKNLLKHALYEPELINSLKPI